MGDMDEEFGQTYYGTVEEQKHPVRFNMMKQVDFPPTRKFIALESDERTAKGSGKPYTQLRKVKLAEDEVTDNSETPPESAAPQFVPEEAGATPQTQTITLPDETPSYEAGTNARWAIGLAYRAYQQVMGTPEDGRGEFPFEVIALHAKELVRMFNEIKSGPTGYDNAKAAAKKIKEGAED